MSYILEALKKSQQERELGQVPRIESLIREAPVQSQAPPHRWLYAAVVLAVLAVAMALYALLRNGGPAVAPVDAASGEGAARTLPASTALPTAPRASELPPPAPLPTPASELAGATPTVVPVAAATPPAPPASRQPPAQPVPPVAAAAQQAPAPAAMPAAPPPAAAPVAAAPAPAAAPPPAGPVAFDDPNSLSVNADPGPKPVPEVLVVPAPPKPGQPLPRGADELRRALLGPDGDASVDFGGALPPPEQGVPIPDDLIADIEAFKKQVRSGAADKRPPPPPPQARLPLPDPEEVVASRTAAPAAPSAKAPRASVELLAKLPPFKMTVHVYDRSPSRRFVYINGRKVSENQKSREGLRVEEVVADGAILSFRGERFFQPR